MRLLLLAARYLWAVFAVGLWFYAGVVLGAHCGDLLPVFVAGLLASRHLEPIRKHGARAGATAYRRITKRRTNHDT